MRPSVESGLGAGQISALLLAVGKVELDHSPRFPIPIFVLVLVLMLGAAMLIIENNSL